MPNKMWYKSLLISLLVLSTSTAKLCAETTTVKEYKIKVLREYIHSKNAYTQGLFFYDNKLIETTGLNGKSTLGYIDLDKNKQEVKLKFDKKYFVEGSTALNDKIYILTWQSRLAFVYDAKTLKYIKTFRYNKEGWGLCSDGTSLIASDGSSTLYFYDENFKLHKKIEVKLKGHKMSLLNELEYIEGKIWANVYLSEIILIIDPETGIVQGVVDCSDLLPKVLRSDDTDVLNGIAYYKGEIYLTGKNWPRLYKVKLVEVKN